MKLISKHEDTFDAKYVYEHNGFIIKETYYGEDDCTHHFVKVYLDNEEIERFNNLKEAIEFIDKKEKIC